MRRTLWGLHLADLTGWVQVYRQQLAQLGDLRAARLAELDEGTRQMDDAVLALEADVARELAAVRSLLDELQQVDPRVRQRLEETRSRLKAAEQAQWASVAALERRVVEERDLSQSLGREVMALASRTRTALADARALTESWPGSVDPVAALEPPLAAPSTEVAGGDMRAAADLIAAVPPQPPSVLAEDAARPALWLAPGKQVGT